MSALSKIETLKAADNPLNIIKYIYKQASGEGMIPPEKIDLLKWYGMYPHRQKERGDDTDYFMKRIKIVGAKISLPQLDALATIGERYAKNFVDFTTRQNVQFHYIRIEELPLIFTLLEEAGLTSRLSAGDGPRPIVSCPLSGLEKDELIDTREIVAELNAYFDKNSDTFANLPRKFKIGIGGCRCHCISHEIQDLGFTAFKEGDEVLFDLTIGGGLSKSRQIAKRAGRYVKKEQIIDVAAAVGRIFKEHGNRENRSKARIRHLLGEWGVEKFVAAIEEALGYSLLKGEKEPVLTPYPERHHFGIHSSKTRGRVNVGFATNRGRVGGDGLRKIHDILTRYKAGGIATTTTQNFIALDIPKMDVDAVIEAMKAAGFKANPSVFEARTQSCTGLPFCKFALCETKDYAASLIADLEAACPDFNEPLSIAVAGCPNGCSHPSIADIGLVATKIKNGGEEKLDGFEIFTGGYLEGEEKSVFGNSTGISATPDKIHRLIVGWIGEYCDNRDSYASFSAFIRDKRF